MITDDERYQSDEDDDYSDGSESWRGDDMYEVDSDADDFSFGDSDDDDYDLDETDANDETDETLEIQHDLANEDQSLSRNVPEFCQYSEPKQDVLQKDNMITGLTIIRTSYLARNTQEARKKKKKAIQVSAASGNNINQRKNVKAIGVRFAAEYIKDQSFITDARDSENENYKQSEDFELRSTELPYPGFARRDTGGGDLFGERYIGPYKDNIKNLVEKGNADKGSKISPAQALELFERDNPNSFLLPTTYEIQCYINQLLQGKEKSSAEIGQEDSGLGVDNDNILDKNMKSWLRERLFGDIQAKPEKIYQEFVQLFPPLANIEKIVLKKKISSTKAVMKNDAWKKII